jgi:hypothetical protein
MQADSEFADIDAKTPSGARVYDYKLGGRSVALSAFRVPRPAGALANRPAGRPMRESPFQTPGRASVLGTPEQGQPHPRLP